MTQESRKPDQRLGADRADFSHAHDLNLVEPDVGRNSKKALPPWEKPAERMTKFDWLLAVNHHPATCDKLRAIRLAIALSHHANFETGLTWVGAERLMREMRAVDRSQLRKALSVLVSCGAVETIKLSECLEVPKGERSVRDKRAVAYRLRFAWAFETFRSHFGTSNGEPERLANSNKKTRSGSTEDPQHENGSGSIEDQDLGSSVDQDFGSSVDQPNSHGIQAEQKTTGGASVPPSAVVAEEAPPVDLPAAPTDLPRTANVESNGQPSDSHGEKEAIRAPTNHRERIKRVEELAPGISLEGATAVAEWWNLSPRSITEIKGKIARKAANGR